MQQRWRYCVKTRHVPQEWVPDSPDEPGGETAVPDGAQSIQGHSRAHPSDADDEANVSTQDRWRGGHIGQQEVSQGVEGIPGHGKAVEGAEDNCLHPSRDGSERRVETDALCPDTGPGGSRGEQAESRDDEELPDRRKVTDYVGYDGTGPMSDGDMRVIETNVQCRDPDPGGHQGMRVRSGDVGADWNGESDGEGVGYDGEECLMDGTMSGACHDSKRAETDPLADHETSQRGYCEYAMAHVPRTPTAPPAHPQSPAEYVGSLHRCRRPESSTTTISWPSPTYQVARTRRDHIGLVRPLGQLVY